MNLNLYKVFLLTIYCSFTFSCVESRNLNEVLENQDIKEKIIIVKIPPFYDSKLSREENFWRYDNFLFPRENISSLPPKGIPNYDALLQVRVDKNGILELNKTDQGKVSDTQKLKKTLERIFKEREENGVYETASNRIVKAVSIQVEDSTKYNAFFGIIETIKESGADPIILRFDDDAMTQVSKIKK